MRIELTKQECRWLANLAKMEKEQADAHNAATPHALHELRRDNMASLEKKLNTAIQRQVARERKGKSSLADTIKAGTEKSKAEFGAPTAAKKPVDLEV